MDRARRGSGDGRLSAAARRGARSGQSLRSISRQHRALLCRHGGKFEQPRVRLSAAPSAWRCSFCRRPNAPHARGLKSLFLPRTPNDCLHSCRRQMFPPESKRALSSARSRRQTDRFVTPTDRVRRAKTLCQACQVAPRDGQICIEARLPSTCTWQPASRGTRWHGR